MSDVKEVSQSERTGVVLQSELDYKNFKTLRDSEVYDTLTPEEQGSIQEALSNYETLNGISSENNLDFDNEESKGPRK